MNKLLILNIILVLVSDCGRPVETTSPIKTAYNDGF